MDDSIVEIEEQLQQLKAFGVRLGETMEQTAEELRATGLNPSEELLADLQQYRRLFQALQSRLASQPGAILVAAAGRTAESVNDLKLDLEGTLEARQALEFLDRLRDLTHVEGSQHPVVMICERARQTAMDVVREADPNSLTVIRAITEGRHPLRALSRILTHEETLNDDQWTELLDQVGYQLGREVSTALARRKLFIPAEDTLSKPRLSICS